MRSGCLGSRQTLLFSVKGFDGGICTHDFDMFFKTALYCIKMWPALTVNTEERRVVKLVAVLLTFNTSFKCF